MSWDGLFPCCNPQLDKRKSYAMDVKDSVYSRGEHEDALNTLQDEIVQDFASIGDLLSQYEYLLEYAASLPVMENEEKSEKNLVEGCQSRVWLSMAVSDGRLSLRADSDTLIVRGILHLLINVLDGRRLDEVAKATIYFPEKAGLMATFDEARRKGIASVVASIRRFAQQSS